MPIKERNEKTSIKVENLDVIWSSIEHADTGKKTLTNFSFDFHNNEKVAVIGRVGCGKTTLFNAILREAYVLGGSIHISGTKLVGIAEQNPVIITGNVRSNILYGSSFDKQRYDRVIEACQLATDFESFPKADLTETGEMGVSLSGG